MNKQLVTSTCSSSSDFSCSAPQIFRVPQFLDSYSDSSASYKRCPLCTSVHSRFHCPKCIAAGEFYHSRIPATQSFREKKEELQRTRFALQALEELCRSLCEPYLRANELQSQICVLRDKNKLLRNMIEERKQCIAQSREKSLKMKDIVDRMRENLPKYADKVAKGDEMAESLKGILLEHSNTFKMKSKELQRTIKLRIQQLKYIFPITTFYAKSTSCTDQHLNSSDDSTLKDSFESHCIHCAWARSSNEDKMQYAIVAPVLPSSGDLSVYYAWGTSDKDIIETHNCGDLHESNPTFNIGAALTYTVQFVQLLAFYLDIRLPYKIFYSDFCGKPMNKPQFVRRVARLNANILYLCFSQNVKLANATSAGETLPNLLQLIDTTNPFLGSRSAMELNAEIADRLQQQLAPDLLPSSDDSNSDEEDSIHKDWEAVPYIECPEVPPGPAVAHLNNSPAISPQQSVSVAGGLVNSLASMWRGFTGR